MAIQNKSRVINKTQSTKTLCSLQKLYFSAKRENSNMQNRCRLKLPLCNVVMYCTVFTVAAVMFLYNDLIPHVSAYDVASKC